VKTAGKATEKIEEIKDFLSTEPINKNNARRKYV
jgi:hypothetical protein